MPAPNPHEMQNAAPVIPIVLAKYVFGRRRGFGPLLLVSCGAVPPQKWMNFYTKVLTRFASSPDLKLEVSFEIPIDSEQAQSKQRMDMPLTALDFKFHFFPWWRCPDYQLAADGVVIEEPLRKYFATLKSFGF